MRHVACDDLNEGSFAITPYDEDGATAVAVASVVLTEDGKRRRVSMPSADQETQSPIGSERRYIGASTNVGQVRLGRMMGTVSIRTVKCAFVRHRSILLSPFFFFISDIKWRVRM